MALGVVLFLLDRVAVLVEIRDSAYRRLGRGGDFDEVKATTLGNLERFAGRHDSDLASVNVDHSHLGRADMLVNADLGLSGRGNSEMPTDKSPPCGASAPKLEF
jgi:hypothetical protein